MSKRQRPHRNDPSALLWWALLGLGLGLMMLAGLVAWQQGQAGAKRSSAAPSALPGHLAPVLSQMRDGRPPGPELVHSAQGTVLAPLMQALLDAHRQRQQALLAYQTQLEAAALGNWLVPANLVKAPGRAQIRQKLAELRASMDALVQRDATVQQRLDDAVLHWAQQWPEPQGARWRRDLLASSGSTARTMNAFFMVEQEIVNKVEALLNRLESAGSSVSLEDGVTQELVFTRPDDLAFYQSTLRALDDLGQREQQWLMAAEQASGQHARQVGELITATLAAGDAE